MSKAQQEKSRAIHTIAPVYDESSRILILGSFPSVRSREVGFYYGHPRNRFWNVLARICGESVPDTEECKMSMLINNRIALWDVVSECDISCSSDGSITSVKPNDIASLISKTNIERIKAEIDGGKTSPEVTLMLATKTVDTERIAYAVNECGIKAIGENRVQELLDKYEDVKDLQCELHFIGTLQSNKVKYIVGKVDLIHSVDSEKLAKEIDLRAGKLGIVQDILIEINCGKEESKSGIMPEDIYEFFRGKNITRWNYCRGKCRKGR